MGTVVVLKRKVPEVGNPDVVTYGIYTFDKWTQKVWVFGRLPIRLSVREGVVFRVLGEAEGSPVLCTRVRQEIRAYFGTNIVPQSTPVAVYELRKKLKRLRGVDSIASKRQGRECRYRLLVG
jgi:hypothetical protein